MRLVSRHYWYHQRKEIVHNYSYLLSHDTKKQFIPWLVRARVVSGNVCVA